MVATAASFAMSGLQAKPVGVSAGSAQSSFAGNKVAFPAARKAVSFRPAARQNLQVTNAVASDLLTSTVKIGTRGSPLALAQAYMTRDLLGKAYPELEENDLIEICIIKTTGDKVLNKPLADIGGKGLFTREIDDAVDDGRVDIAVHSMKDVPTYLPEGQVLPCMLEREDTRDAFISPKGKHFKDLPQGAVVGSASLRRQAQILAVRPDLKLVNFRGNVQSRLRKVGEGDVDATLLALAGLKRMDLEEHITTILSYEDMLPAIAQGAIGIACREENTRALELLKALNHEQTRIAAECERAFLRALDGSCRTPIAGYAYKEGDRLKFQGLVAAPDGTKIFKDSIECDWNIDDAVKAGIECGNMVKAAAGEDFMSWATGSATAGSSFADLKN